ERHRERSLHFLNCDSHRGTHRGTNGDAFYVLTFDRLWLQVQDEGDERFNVVFELWAFEAHLADDGVYDAAVIVAKLDLTGLIFFNNPGHVGRDSARAGRGHQPAGAEHLA